MLGIIICFFVSYNKMFVQFNDGTMRYVDLTYAYFKPFNLDLT